ncbi:MAG TPA: anthranilate synthase component I [Candidatus Margulisiibacteriota bacterium]|nr:anthranilate synthase component I [Candidatus Margulisiibacteriota bacterium]
MYSPSLKEFLRLTQKGNVIPVYKEINADLETPVSSFLKLKQGDYSFLLESVEGQQKLARFSFLGSDPLLVFKSKGRNIEIIEKGKNPRRFVTRSDPLNEIKSLMSRFKSVNVKGLPRFSGGMVGYIGYDMVKFFERLPDKNPDDLKLADSVFMLTETLLIFDHLKHKIKILSNVILPKGPKNNPKVAKEALYARAVRNIEEIEGCFRKDTEFLRSRGDKSATKSKITSNFRKAEFEKLVKKAKQYIKNGDIIQAVLSQRFSLRLKKEPFDIYRSLRSLNPSPYMYFLKLKGITLVGSSPEMLVRCEEGLVETRPIAGTRRRSEDEEEDLRLEEELLKDAKEKAEHLMLVDLGRNDLGRVCLTGTVKVSEFMRVERYSHVMHLVSEVKGKLDSKKYDIYDCLRAAFPAGTVSGSPKIRAMEIIDELENIKRGTYAGCVGYFSFSHNLDTCITIRTILIKDGFAYIQAGAGIVADSNPRKEYYETVNKARALVEAIIK